MNRLLTIILVCLFGASELTAEDLISEGVLTLLGEIHVPALDAGVLTDITVRPGMHVTKEMLLAKQDSTEAQVTRDQAETDLTNAQRLARNDLKVQLARKAHKVAEAELKRAVEAAERFSKAVSQTEIDRLQLAAEQAELHVLQMRFELKTALVEVASHQAVLRLAEHRLKQRTVSTPTSGIVVEVLKQPGEWVEPGETVVRIVRMDRLRVEGFLSAQQANGMLVGKTAIVQVKLHPNEKLDIEGEVTFVSPEIHPVNGMVRIWVEIDNEAMNLRPGLQATIKIAR